MHNNKNYKIHNIYLIYFITQVDTKPAYQNLYQRVEESVESFLDRQRWKPDLNKNKMREELRSSIIR